MLRFPNELILGVRTDSFMLCSVQIPASKCIIVASLLVKEMSRNYGGRQRPGIGQETIKLSISKQAKIHRKHLKEYIA